MRYVAILVFISLFFHAEGQDIRFSQFYNTPTIINPASTGLINGNHRLVAGYHDQNSKILRGDSFSAAFFAYDGQLSVSENGSFGFSLVGIVDRSGELNYGAEQSKLLLSYRHSFNTSNRKHSIGLGLDIENSKRLIDVTDRRLSSQLKNYSYPIGDFFPDDNHSKHFDLGAGLLWSSLSDSGYNYQLGISAHHLNQASISYYRDLVTDTLTVRYSAQGSAQIPISQRISLLPSILYFSQGGHQSIITGSLFRFENKGMVKNLEFGMFFNYEKSDVFTNVNGLEHLTMAANINFKKLTFSFSYDYDFSNSLREAGSFDSALELVLGYTFYRSASVTPSSENL